ncbi:MAG: CHAT domain-containing protein [Gammaproteobacteria bacterium]
MILKSFVIVITAIFLSNCVSFQELSVDEQLSRIEHYAQDAFLQGDMKEALRQWQRGIVITRVHQKEKQYGLYLLQAASIEELLGNYSASKDHADQALETAVKIADQSLKARSHIALANAFSRLSNNRQALDELRRARPIIQQLDDIALESDRLLIEGRIDQSHGDLDKALSSYKTALGLANTLADFIRVSKNLNNIGGIYRLKGEYATALPYYEESLEIKRKLRDLAGQGKVLGNICSVYQGLQDYEKALDYCEQSLRITKKLGDRAREANQLNSIGAIYRYLGNDKQAIEKYQMALDIKTDLSDKAGVGRSLNNLGEVYWQTAQYSKALKYFSKSLSLKEEIGDRPGQSATHYNLALLSMELKEYDQAMRHFKDAHNLQIEIGQPELLWRILDGISLLYEKQNNWQSAILFGKLAVNTIQAMRFRLQDLDKSLQKSFLLGKESVYRRTANQLIDQGRLIEGQQIINMLKEDEYFDFIRRDAARGQNLNSRIECISAEKGFCARYNEISTDLIALGNRASVLNKKGSHRTASENIEYQQILADMKVAKARFDAFLADVKHELEKQPQILIEQAEKKLFAKPMKLQQILEDLEPEDVAVVLHYIVREDRLSIVLTTATQRLVREADISAKELRQKVAQFRDMIVDRRPVEQVAQELYAWVIGPVEKDLKDAGARIIMLSLDDVLRYLPISALYDGEHYLAERYAFSLYNAAANDSDIKDQPDNEWKVAGFGLSEAVNVDIGDGKVKRFDPLPNVPNELDAIVKENDEDSRGILQGEVKLNRFFTDLALTNLLGEGGHQVIHIASHFNLNPGDETDSYLVLGEGKTLSMARIDEEQISFKGIDLLVLSACNTAMGENTRGKEVESFGAAAQNQGAKAILASLWPVSDVSTSEFMQTLYSIREKQQLTKSKALQQTQIQFIQSKNESNNDQCRAQALACEDQKSAFAHPYHWSAFVLMGNWL